MAGAVLSSCFATLLPQHAALTARHRSWRPGVWLLHRRTQDEPAFCGLASIAMVLNALAIDPKRAWKGPWRWFHEQMLDCCQPLDQVLQTGIVLEQVIFIKT